MGLSSSQARLLHLTSRMHQIEYKAAKLEAQKLQMANKSRRVYQEYEEALEATKIQYKSLNEDASITFRDATMNILQNGSVPTYSEEKSAKQYFLQDMDGKIMVTPTVAYYYHLEEFDTGQTLEQYLESIDGISKSQKTIHHYYYEDAEPKEVVSFNQIGNTVKSPGEMDYSGAVTNTIPQTSQRRSDIVWNTFQTTPQHVDTSGCQKVTSTHNYTEGQTYIVDDVYCLDKLLTQTGAITSGVTFVLTKDIDLTEYCNEHGWSGIQNFQGTFDGNGHKITGLNGTQGLFASIGSDATVKNLGIEGANISGSTVGCIAGKNNGGKIDNCYVSNSTIYTTNMGGGVCGQNIGGKISNCTTDVNISSTLERDTRTGGIVGADGNGTTVDGEISHCYSKGTLTGRLSGGIVGNHHLGDQSSNNQSYTRINDCYSECVTRSNGDPSFAAGGLIGWKEGDHTIFGGSNTYWSDYGYGYTGVSSLDLAPNDITDGTVTKLNRITIPSDADFRTNVYAAILKLNNGNPTVTEAQVNAYVNKLNGYSYISGIDDNHNPHTKKDPELIANVNYYITEYLKGNLTAEQAFINEINEDIVNGTAIASTNTVSILAETATTLGIDKPARRSEYEGWAVDRAEDTGWTPLGADGEVKIPSKESIAKQLYCVLNKQGHTDLELGNVINWVNNKYPSDNDKKQLAYLNEAIQESINNDYSIITNGSGTDIYNLINNGTKWTSNRTDYNERYDIEFKSGDINITYKQEQKDNPETVDFWDPSIPAVAQAMAMWALGQKGVKIVSEEQASNYLYLKNMLEIGEAVLTTFDPSKAATLFENVTMEDISTMSETEYNEAMNIFNTSVSVETHLQEVADEKNLKKAEAKYEADMRRIDMKDRQYDRELAALDAERNAIKNEMETLKTVAKDNVDRTFKLFS